MSKIYEVENMLETYIPPTLAESWDNVGLLVGNRNAEVKKILLTVDISDSVISEAVQNGCELIISHHPIIFDPIKAVLSDSLASGKIHRLISLGISALCIHTPLDIVEGGMNDKLAEKCGLTVKNKLVIDDMAVGRLCSTDKLLSVYEFCKSVKSSIGSSSITYYDCKKSVNSVAVVSGSGGFALLAAKGAGCDTLLTGEMKHNNFIEASDLDINVVCAGHYHTELWGMDLVSEYLTEYFPQIKIFKAESLNNLYQSV